MGPTIGGRLGFFPLRQVGVEAVASLFTGGYATGTGLSPVLTGRGQLAVRVLDQGAFGVRAVGGAGVFAELADRGTSHPGVVGEIHFGAAATWQTSSNVWLRLDLVDMVTAARDSGYTQDLGVELGIVTRLGRQDRW
jgi:hypothetical protein